MCHHLARYWKLWLCSLALSGGIAAFWAQHSPSSGTVVLRIEAEKMQPVGMPLIIQVHLKNVGSKPISWWCGIGSQLPGTDNFQVETRHKGQVGWSEVAATNNEANEGSGMEQKLKVGESLVVPLVVPVRPQSVVGHMKNEAIYVDTIDVRVRCGLDATGGAVETQVFIYHDPQLTENRRFRMICGILDGDKPFWNHLARNYADTVVLDAAYRLAEVDNRHVAEAAFRVLARQPALPMERGADLARLVRKWVLIGDLDYSVIASALSTQSEIARKTAFELLVETKNSRICFPVVDALRMSPGDVEWLKRVRAEIEGFQRRGIKNERLEHNSHLAISWINQRLANLQR
jgi:hypothetical protein